MESAIVARALARRVCETAFVGPVLAQDLLRRSGADGGVDAALRTIALSRDLHRLSVADGSVIGEGQLAVDAAGATSAVVLTAAGDGHAVAEVPLSPPTPGVDLTRSVVPTGTARLSPEELTAWTALAVTLTAADLVGAMEGALALATRYAKERRQYGAPIGSYQARSAKPAGADWRRVSCCRRWPRPGCSRRSSAGRGCRP